MADENLKACPFCENPTPMFRSSADYYWVVCAGCGASSAPYTKAGAIYNWNRRPPEQDARVRELTRVLAEVGSYFDTEDDLVFCGACVEMERRQKLALEAIGMTAWEALEYCSKNPKRESTAERVKEAKDV